MKKEPMKRKLPPPVPVTQTFSENKRRVEELRPKRPTLRRSLGPMVS